MKVLMQTRQNVFDLAGGDTTQLVKTKEALESKGIDVDLSLDLRPDVSGYDVVHLFNLTRVQETFIQSKNAKEAGKPVVLSTIYWPTDSFEKSAANGLRGFWENILASMEWSASRPSESTSCAGSAARVHATL